MTETTILVRLGRVFYWAACALAGIIAIGGPLLTLHRPDSVTFITFVSWAVAGLIWLIGRGCRYVLANE